MKYLVSAFLFALSVVASGFHAHAAEVSNDEQAVRSMEQSWLKAASTGDKAAMKQMLDDQYVERTPNGSIRTKADVLSAPPLPASAMQEIQILRVEVSGDTAVVLGTNQYRTNPSATAINFMYMDVFQRRDGAWRVIASQMSQQPPG
ncbi:nuclear transport factor 2 family protein [Dyella telluris]|uniref:Nuclear transport factor 2 family protein n=1 Tax=Dyella telluris TaxID=2763498 RepID=A0A7G8Q0V1_9GAMM|nr:nuclear transport factor 2 family protein [Dyella telluris]QNK00409.1 nuclear transport factor 2 family protein [Dyella telluris]